MTPVLAHLEGSWLTISGEPGTLVIRRFSRVPLLESADGLEIIVVVVQRKDEESMSLAMLVLAAALNPGGLIAWLIIGLLAGWLAGVIMPGRGFGLLGDLVIGLIGAFVGGLIVNLVSPDSTFGFWGSLLVALIGACILVAIVHAVMGRRGTVTRP